MPRYFIYYFFLHVFPKTSLLKIVQKILFITKYLKNFCRNTTPKNNFSPYALFYLNKKKKMLSSLKFNTVAMHKERMKLKVHGYLQRPAEKEKKKIPQSRSISNKKNPFHEKKK